MGSKKSSKVGPTTVRCSRVQCKPAPSANAPTARRGHRHTADSRADPTRLPNAGGLQLWRTDGNRAWLEAPLAVPLLSHRGGTPLDLALLAFNFGAQRNSRVTPVSFAKLAHNRVGRRNWQGEESVFHRQQLVRYGNVKRCFEGSRFPRQEQRCSSEAEAPGKLGVDKLFHYDPQTDSAKGIEAWYPTDRNQVPCSTPPRQGKSLDRGIVSRRSARTGGPRKHNPGLRPLKRLHRSMLPSRLRSSFHSRPGSLRLQRQQIDWKSRAGYYCISTFRELTAECRAHERLAFQLSYLR